MLESRTTMPAVDRKGRLRIPAQAAPTQPVAERVRNWDEVFLGFDAETARREAQRCLQCPAAPCTKACPLGNDIAAALWRIEHADPVGAADVFRETSNLPEVCGRICPQEKLCEGSCVVGLKGKATPVQIGKLEQYCTDLQRATTGIPVPEVACTGAPVAIVGAGPAGLAAAEELAKTGHPVTVYDRWPLPGGTLRYGIPSFKLSKAVLDAKIAQLRAMGITFVPERTLGRDVDVAALRANGFAAVFLGYGASVGNRLEIEGEDLPGVHLATDFLVRANLPPTHLPGDRRRPLTVGERVVIIGGGDTASDCARSAIRLGAREVTWAYRRTEAEMPGRAEERRYARDEGVRIEFLAAPLRVLGVHGAGRVAGVELARMELTEPDASGRRGVRPVAGGEFTVPADTVVVATGYHVNEAAAAAVRGLATRTGAIVITETDTGRTSVPGVYAGGDAATGPHLVATAVAAGRRAARAIHEDLAVAGPRSEHAGPATERAARGARHAGVHWSAHPLPPPVGALRRPGPEDGSVGALLDQWIDDLRFSNTQDGD